MKILRFLVRFVIYVVILFPLLSNILGGKWYSNVIAFVILLAIGSILELRGIMKHVVDSILGLFAGVMKNQDNSVSNSIGGMIAPDEKVVECVNCGTLVTLRNGKGKCDSCGTPL